MAKLATLIVALQLESAQLRQGLDAANRKLDEFAKQSEKTANILAGAFAWDELKEGLTTFRDWLTAGADGVVVMGNLAKAAGTPVEEFSKLAYAAERFGFESDNLAESFGQLAEYMAEAQKGSAEHAALFKGVGVAYQDATGKLRSTGDVFTDLAQRFSETNDGAAKTALAVKFFGEEGIKLIPMLNQGKAGLAALGEEAERAGKVITEQGAASVGEFNASLKRLQAASDGLAASVAQELAPSMAAFAAEITTGKHSTEAFEMAAKSLALIMRTLAMAGMMTATTFEVIGKAAAGAAAWTVALFDDDAKSSQSGEAAKAALESVLEAGRARGKQMHAIWETSGPGAVMATDAEKAKPAADKFLSEIERTKKALEKAAEAQKKLAETTKKAMEDSSKAMDDYVKSALALDRKHADIARDTAKRRADFEGALPTDGFADWEDALAKMEDAQKAAASLRDRANAADKAGDIIGADAITREADELDALAERASAAVDAFRNMGKEAEEKASQLFDAQIAAAVALEQTFDGLDREVAAQRAALYDRDADPTAGFDSFNVALYAMSEALKEEARLRSEAALLEREGKLGEARQTLLAAEAARAFAETASGAADALAEMEQARANVPGELGGMLTGRIGGTTSAMVEGVKTGAAAGPVGAVVGGLVGLLSQSETFQGALDGLEEIFQKLADSVGRLIEPLLPLLEVVAAVADGLGALLEVLSPIIEFVARPLFEVFKGFGLVVLNLVRWVGEIINSIAGLFGGEGFDLSGIDKSLRRLESATYDSAREQQRLADATREAAGGLNGVSWWRESLARFDATESGRSGGSGGAGGGAAPVIHDNSQHHYEVNGVTDVDEVVERVTSRRAALSNRRDGTRLDRNWVP